PCLVNHPFAFVTGPGSMRPAGETILILSPFLRNGGVIFPIQLNECNIFARLIYRLFPIMTSPKRHTITAALPYANGPLHLGHVAGVYVPADIYARYLRLRDEDVIFICGSDEHGAAITLRANKENTGPQEIVDKYHNLIKSSFENFGISFDVYHRTSEKLHHETAQEFFLNLHDKGIFEEQTSEQYYDEE